MAVRIAMHTGQDLRLVHRVLWELLDVVSEVFISGDKKIRWAMRGEMTPASWRDERWYDFRCYQRLAKKMPSWKETQQITGLALRGSTGTKQGRWTTPRANRRSSKEQGSGCLTSVVIVIVALAGLFISTV